MKNVAKLLVMAVLSAVLIVGFAGCVTVNVAKSTSASDSGASSSAASASSADTASSSSAASSTASASASAAASQSSAASAGETEPGGAGGADLSKSQRFGRDATGYVTVPSDWKDFTNKVDSRIVDASYMTYIVDPTTEFTSGVESHWAYANSITLETFPCKYTDKADELLYKYRGETDNYTEPSIEKGAFCGKNASIVACSSADGIDITNIAIEKDANSCILITAWATPSSDAAVLDYVATWSMSK